MNIDAIDAAILRVLRNNARVANKELAEQVGIAPSTCLVRVRRLERQGVIRGYHTELEPRAIGVGIQAMVAARLEKHARSELEAFKQHLLDQDEVLSVYHVTGAHDYLVHVAVRDTEHLRQFVLTALTERPEVAHLETHLIYEQRRNTGLPLYPAEPLG